VKGFSAEAKVGIFVLAGLAILIFFSLRIGSLHMPSEQAGYRISTFFETTAGLDSKAAVRYAGIQVGEVESIALTGSRAKVTMRIQPGVEINKDATAELGTLGLLGERYLMIRSGTPGSPLVQDGDTIKAHDPVSFDQILTSVNEVSDDVKAITASVRDSVATEQGEETLRGILENLDELTASLRDLVIANRQQMDSVIQNIEQLTDDLQQITGDHRQEIGETITSINLIAAEFERTMPTILKNLDQLIEGTNALVAANSSRVDESLENIRVASANLESTLSSMQSISRKIDNGEGSIGKLLSSEETHDNLNRSLTELTATLEDAQGFLGQFSKYKMHIGYRGEYLDAHGTWRNVISLRAQPKLTKFYLIELTDSPFGNKSTEDIEITTDSSLYGTETQYIHKERVTDSMLFSLQIGRRLGPLTVRGGLIESKGGVGADLALFGDHFRLSVEGFDFADDREPHLKLMAGIHFADYFQLSAGWDDPLNEDRESMFVGGGLSFADDDLKFLLGLLPLASGN